MRLAHRWTTALVIPALMGCSATTTLHVVRPATADLHFDHLTLSLGAPWTGPRAHGPEFQALLEKRLRAAPGKLVTIGGGTSLVLSGKVDDLSFDQTTARLSTTCTDYTKAAPLRYSCVLLRRGVTARVQVSVALTRAGAPLFQLTLPLSMTQRTDHYLPIEEATPGSEAPVIDPEQIYSQLLDEAASRLVKALAPSIATFDRPALDCGTQAKACKDGWSYLAKCQYTLADQTFRKVIGLVPEGPPRAAGLWGLALTQELSGHFDDSRTTLLSAQKSDASQSAFRDELSNLPMEEASAKRVVIQGAARLGACQN